MAAVAVALGDLTPVKAAEPVERDRSLLGAIRPPQRLSHAFRCLTRENPRGGAMKNGLQRRLAKLEAKAKIGSEFYVCHSAHQTNG